MDTETDMASRDSFVVQGSQMRVAWRDGLRA
jgi:hypothetical protein